MMLVSIGNPRVIRRRWLSHLAFLMMMVSPFLVLFGCFGMAAEARTPVPPRPPYGVEDGACRYSARGSAYATVRRGIIRGRLGR